MAKMGELWSQSQGTWSHFSPESKARRVLCSDVIRLKKERSNVSWKYSCEFYKFHSTVKCLSESFSGTSRRTFNARKAKTACDPFYGRNSSAGRLFVALNQMRSPGMNADEAEPQFTDPKEETEYWRNLAEEYSARSVFCCPIFSRLRVERLASFAPFKCEKFQKLRARLRQTGADISLYKILCCYQMT